MRAGAAQARVRGAASHRPETRDFGGGTVGARQAAAQEESVMAQEARGVIVRAKGAPARRGARPAPPSDEGEEEEEDQGEGDE